MNKNKILKYVKKKLLLPYIKLFKKKFNIEYIGQVCVASSVVRWLYSEKVVSLLVAPHRMLLEALCLYVHSVKLPLKRQYGKRL